jgi:hypothetical protein
MTVFSRRFQALLKTYDQLSTLILDTIRIDLRCRTIHYLDAAMQDVSILNLFSAYNSLYLNNPSTIARAHMILIMKQSSRTRTSSISTWS